jgi:hypothetical protein
MALEEQLLAQMINKTFDDARSAVNQLIDEHNGGGHSPEASDAQDLVSFYISKAFNEVAVLAERMNLPLYSTDIRRMRSDLKDLSDISYAPGSLDFYSEPLMRAQQSFAPLEVMLSGRALTGLSVFEHVLKSTANILSVRNVKPKSEAEIRAVVRDTLECCFFDVRREIPVSKNLKVYKPDLGVASLKAAAEYKIAKSHRLPGASSTNYTQT